MEDIDQTLCKLITKLTSAELISLKSMRDGSQVGRLLRCIDALFSATAELCTWSVAKTKLEAFLAGKGLNQQILDLDEALIASETLEHVISAVIQLLSVFAVFNGDEWTAALDGLNLERRSLLQQIMDPMIKDIKDELTSTPDSTDIKGILLKLERQEGELGEARTSLQLMDAELHDAKQEIEKLTASNSALTAELRELNKVKNETIKQTQKRQTALMTRSYPSTSKRQWPSATN